MKNKYLNLKIRNKPLKRKKEKKEKGKTSMGTKNRNETNQI